MISQAIWAQQHKTHQLLSATCGKIYFHIGGAFGLAAVAWILCVLNILLRVIGRKAYRDEASFQQEQAQAQVGRTDLSAAITPGFDDVVPTHKVE